MDDNFILPLWALMSKVVAGYQGIKMTQDAWDRFGQWVEKKEAYYTEKYGEAGKKEWNRAFSAAFDLIVANQTVNHGKEES